MTSERAKQIRDTFGPCSVMYECMELAEIVRDFDEMTERAGVPVTEEAWLEVRLTVETVWAEREGIPRLEREEFIEGIRDRLKELGALMLEGADLDHPIHGRFGTLRTREQGGR